MCVEFILSYLLKWEIMHGPPLAATGDSDGGFLVSGNRTEGPNHGRCYYCMRKRYFDAFPQKGILWVGCISPILIASGLP